LKPTFSTLSTTAGLTYTIDDGRQTTDGPQSKTY